MNNNYETELEQNMVLFDVLPLEVSLYAQKDLKTRATQVGIDERGYYRSI